MSQGHNLESLILELKASADSAKKGLADFSNAAKASTQELVAAQRAAADQVAQLQRGLQDTLTGALREGSEKRVRAVRDEGERIAAEQAKAADKAAREQEKAAQAAAKAQQKAAESAAKDAQRSAEAQAKAQEQAAERAIKAQQAAANQIARLSGQLQDQINRATMGGVDYRIAATKREAIETAQAIIGSLATEKQKQAALVLNAEATRSKLAHIAQEVAASEKAAAEKAASLQEAAAKRTAAAHEEAARRAAAAQSQIPAAMSRTEQASEHTRSSLEKWGQAGAVIIGVKLAVETATQAIGKFKEALIGSNADLEGMQIGLAAVVNKSLTIRDAQGKVLDGQEKFNAAQALSNDLIRKFQFDQLQTVFTTKDLVQASQTLSSMVLGAGGGMEDLRRVTGMAATAAAALQLPITQVAYEMNELFAGRQLASSPLQQRLHLTAAQFEEIKKGGKEAIQAVMDSMQGLMIANKAYQASWEGIESTLSDLGQLFSREAGNSLFQALKADLQGLIDKLLVTKNGVQQLRPEIRNAAVDLGIGLAGAFRMVRDTAGPVLVVLGSVTRFLYENADALKVAAAAVTTYLVGLRSLAIMTTVVEGAMALRGVIELVTISFANGATAVDVFKLALATTPWGIALVAASALAGGLVYLKLKSDEAAAATKRLSEAAHRDAEQNLANAEAAKANWQQTQTLVTKHDELARKVNKTAEEKAELKRIIEQLKALNPQYAAQLDGLTDKVIGQTDMVGKLRQQWLDAADAASRYASASVDSAQLLMNQERDAIARLKGQLRPETFPGGGTDYSAVAYNQSIRQQISERQTGYDLAKGQRDAATALVAKSELAHDEHVGPGGMTTSPAHEAEKSVSAVTKFIQSQDRQRQAMHDTMEARQKEIQQLQAYREEHHLTGEALDKVQAKIGKLEKLMQGGASSGTPTSLSSAEKLYALMGFFGATGVSGQFHEDRGDHKHGGVDLVMAAGTPIKSASAGTVKESGWDPGGGGFYVAVTDDDGKVHYYMHMRERPRVRKGQEVGRDDILGQVGSTGRSSGPHLHYEVRVPGTGAVNPADAFAAQQGDAAKGESLFAKGLKAITADFKLAKDEAGSNLGAVAEATQKAQDAIFFYAQQVAKTPAEHKKARDAIRAIEADAVADIRTAAAKKVDAHFAGIVEQAKADAKADADRKAAAKVLRDDERKQRLEWLQAGVAEERKAYDDGLIDAATFYAKRQELQRETHDQIVGELRDQMAQEGLTAAESARLLAQVNAEKRRYAKEQRDAESDMHADRLKDFETIGKAVADVGRLFEDLTTKGANFGSLLKDLARLAVDAFKQPMADAMAPIFDMGRNVAGNIVKGVSSEIPALVKDIKFVGEVAKAGFDGIGAAASASGASIGSVSGAITTAMGGVSAAVQGVGGALGAVVAIAGPLLAAAAIVVPWLAISWFKGKEKEAVDLAAAMGRFAANTATAKDRVQDLVDGLDELGRLGILTPEEVSEGKAGAIKGAIDKEKRNAGFTDDDLDNLKAAGLSSGDVGDSKLGELRAAIAPKMYTGGRSASELTDAELEQYADRQDVPADLRELSRQYKLIRQLKNRQAEARVKLPKLQFDQAENTRGRLNDLFADMIGGKMSKEDFAKEAAPLAAQLRDFWQRVLDDPAKASQHAVAKGMLAWLDGLGTDIDTKVQDAIGRAAKIQQDMDDEMGRWTGSDPMKAAFFDEAGNAISREQKKELDLAAALTEHEERLTSLKRDRARVQEAIVRSLEDEQKAVDAILNEGLAQRTKSVTLDKLDRIADVRRKAMDERDAHQERMRDLDDQIAKEGRIYSNRVANIENTYLRERNAHLQTMRDLQQRLDKENEIADVRSRAAAPAAAGSSGGSTNGIAGGYAGSSNAGGGLTTNGAFFVYDGKATAPGQIVMHDGGKVPHAHGGAIIAPNGRVVTPNTAQGEVPIMAQTGEEVASRADVGEIARVRPILRNLAAWALANADVRPYGAPGNGYSAPPVASSTSSSVSLQVTVTGNTFGGNMTPEDVSRVITRDMQRAMGGLLRDRTL